MRKIAIGLLAGAGALLTGSANASDIYTSSEYTNSDLIQQVRMVCDEDGRCYRTRGGSRVIVRDSYAYAPRERYIEHRRYRDWDEPRAGVGIRAPGVSERLQLSLRSLRRSRQYSFARGNSGWRSLLAGEATAERRSSHESFRCDDV